VGTLQEVKVHSDETRCCQLDDFVDPVTIFSSPFPKSRNRRFRECETGSLKMNGVSWQGLAEVCISKLPFHLILISRHATRLTALTSVLLIKRNQTADRSRIAFSETKSCCHPNTMDDSAPQARRDDPVYQPSNRLAASAVVA
jgi:hypothetical protein